MQVFAATFGEGKRIPHPCCLADVTKTPGEGRFVEGDEAVTHVLRHLYQDGEIVFTFFMDYYHMREPVIVSVLRHR